MNKNAQSTTRDAQKTVGDMAVEIKRHEYKLPLANWLRDEINETLARYDIPSDGYEADVQIDALCVVAVDKVEAALMNAAEAERDALAEALERVRAEEREVCAQVVESNLGRTVTAIAAAIRARSQEKAPGD